MRFLLPFGSFRRSISFSAVVSTSNMFLSTPFWEFLDEWIQYMQKVYGDELSTPFWEFLVSSGTVAVPFFNLVFLLPFGSFG